MDIIIYGLCATTDYVENRILKEHNIVGYTDSYAKISIYKGKPFYQLIDIKRAMFDYIIISIQDRKTAWQISEILIREIGIEEQKVIPFFIYAESEVFHIHMRECNHDIQGFILGNSHVFYGILTDYLSVPTMKFSASSQDIFSSYKTITGCIEAYHDKLENLKYVLIDLYDYNEFNRDLSLSSVMFSNLVRGGVLEEHNFRANKMYNFSFEEELFNRTYMLADKNKVSNIMSVLFGNKGNCVIDRREYVRWTHIEEYEPMDSSKLFAGIVQKRNENTIAENKHTIKLMVEKIQGLNPEIKIIFTLLPRYIMMERVSEPFMAGWKAEFEDIMHELMQEYGVLYWNYKSCEEVSSNWRFWKDCNHLNTAGAICLTSILDRDLKSILY